MRRLAARAAGGYRALHPNARRFLALSFLAALAQSMFALVFNLYVLSLGYDREFMGLLGSLPGLTVAGLAVPLALACHRIPARLALLAGCGLTAAAMAGSALTGARLALELAAVLLGAATALLSITAYPLLARSSTEEGRQGLFSGQFAVSMVASFLGSLLAGRLAAAAALMLGGGEGPAAYRAVMLAAGAAAAAAALPALRINEPPHPPRAAGALEGIGFRHALGVLGPQLVVGLGAGLVMPYLNIFFRDGFGLDAGQLGLCMSLLPLSMAFGAALGPWLVKREGPLRAIIIFQTLSIPFLATMGFSGLLLPTLAAAFVRTMLMNASWPVFTVYMLSNFTPARHAGATALYIAGWNLVFAAGARASGSLQMTSGFTLPFLGTIACYTLATALLALRLRAPRAAEAV
jgi:MFS family permease